MSLPAFVSALYSAQAWAVASAPTGRRLSVMPFTEQLQLVVVSLLATLGSNVGHTAWYWTWATGIAGGFANICFGAVWGITARQRSLAVVQQRAVTEALRMAVAFTFAIAAVGKALSFAAMTDFFTRSGYSISFLKFIMIAEALGAVGILIPWAFIPSLIGLTIDM